MGTTETPLAEQIVAAQKAATAAWDHLYTARSEWAAACCIHARLVLERYALDHPNLTGLDFEINVEYDDEGHYPEYLTVYPVFEGEPSTRDDDYFDEQDEIRDLLDLNPELARHFAGTHDDADRFGITLEDLRKRGF